MRGTQWVQAAVTLLFCIGIGFLNLWAALLAALLGAVLIGIGAAAQNRQDRRLHALCDEIDRVMRNSEKFTLDNYQEGVLGILAAEIRKMTIRLREQNHALRSEKHLLKESLEDISHQLRTPLTSMMLILNMLGKPGLDRETQMQFLQELRMLTERMQWLIETLLRLSRLEAGAVRFQTEPVDCRALIDAALDPLRIAMELKEITLTEEITGDPAFIGDMQYCTEALGNLLKNCMEHTPRGGEIRIAAAENSIYTGIVITDTGSGIAEEDLPHIFERFYRGSEFSKKGYGIGLNMAQRVIAEQNGAIQVRNASPHGAEFDLRFYKTTV